MVAPSTSSLSLTISSIQTGIVWSDAALRTNGLNGIRINWGRNQLSDSPKNPSMEIEFFPNTLVVNSAVANFTYALIELKLGEEKLFRGMIDNVEIVPSRHHIGWLIRVSATTGDNLLNIPYNNLSNRSTSISGSTIAVETFISQNWPTAVWPLQTSLTGQRLNKIGIISGTQKVFDGRWADWWNAYMQIPAMQYSSWSADHLKVWPTLAFSDQVLSPVVVNADQVTDLDGRLSITIDDRPRRLVESPGATPLTYSENESIRSTPVFTMIESFQSGNDVTVRRSEAVTQKATWLQRSADLLAAQRTSPRRLSVKDTDLQHLPTSALERIFCPWETDIELVLSDDRYSELTKTTTPTMHPIGGTLIINHDHIRHDMLCAWTSGTTTKKWSQQTGQWSQKTTDWTG